MEGKLLEAKEFLRCTIFSIFIDGVGRYLSHLDCWLVECKLRAVDRGCIKIR